jgi:hypothetical protein
VVGVVVVVVVVVVVCVCVCVDVWEHLAPSAINYNYCFWLLAVGSPRRAENQLRGRGSPGVDGVSSSEIREFR